MQRHSDRKAYLGERERHSLQWGGGIRDGGRDALSNNGKESSRDDADDKATFSSQERHPSHHHYPGTLLSDTSTPAGGASPRPEKEQGTPVLSLSNSPASDRQRSARRGRLVPVGEHHEGSFGVYMAHKMEKLRDQVDSAVARLEGEVVSRIGFAGCGSARDWISLLRLYYSHVSLLAVAAVGGST